MVPSRIRFHCAKMGTPALLFLMKLNNVLIHTYWSLDIFFSVTHMYMSSTFQLSFGLFLVNLNEILRDIKETTCAVFLANICPVFCLLLLLMIFIDTFYLFVCFDHACAMQKFPSQKLNLRCSSDPSYCTRHLFLNFM